MKIQHVIILFVYALGMAVGQLLFKAASKTAGIAPSQNFIASLATNVWFLGAVFLYGALTVVWVWILTLVPLSRAYPFVVISFAVTPLGAAYFFAEPVNTYYFLGLAVILIGLAILLFSGV